MTTTKVRLDWRDQQRRTEITNGCGIDFVFQAVNSEGTRNLTDVLNDSTVNCSSPQDHDCLRRDLYY